MKYKILLSLLVVSVLGCGEPNYRIDPDTLPNELRGKTRHEIKALYGSPTYMVKHDFDKYADEVPATETWLCDANWIDEVSGFAFKCCIIDFGPAVVKKQGGTYFNIEGRLEPSRDYWEIDSTTNKKNVKVVRVRLDNQVTGDRLKKRDSKKRDN